MLYLDLGLREDVLFYPLIRLHVEHHRKQHVSSQGAV